MDAKDKLQKQGFIDESFSYAKYFQYMNNIFASVIDYGYVSKVVSGQEDNSNVGRKDVEEHFAFRVRDDKKESFEHMMQDLNIYLSKEQLTSAGQRYEFYTFKSKNIPELKNIIRGCVKIKQQETEIAKQTMAYVR